MKYIKLDDLQSYCDNQKDHSITPNDFQRMNHYDFGWHIGTPTIEEIDKDNQYCYALCFYYDGWWLSDYLFKANHEEGCFENSPNNGQKVCKFKFSDDIAWQRIEPFEEK